MIQIDAFLYMPPRIGDVALMTMNWHDTEVPTTLRHSVVPICGTDAWWHWCWEDPLVVQQAFQHAYANIQTHEEYPDADPNEPGDS